MGIYIPNMEMPESCPCELLGIGYDLYCSFANGIPARTKEYDECCQNSTRPSWCPLVHIPEQRKVMYEDLIKRLKVTEEMLRTAQFNDAASLIKDAVDAIEELCKMVSVDQEIIIEEWNRRAKT